MKIRSKMRKLAGLVVHNAQKVIKSVWIKVLFVLRTINYKLNLLVFGLSYQKNSFFFNLRNNLYKYLYLIYFLFLAQMCWLTYFYSAETVLSTSISDDISYMIGAGTLIGSILAIGYSISILVIQHSADKLPPRFYKVLLRTYFVDQVIYWIVACFVLLLFMLAPSGLESRALFSLAVFLVGVTLFFVQLLLQKLQQRLDPQYGLEIIQKNSINILRSLREHAGKVAKLESKNPNQESNEQQILTAAMSKYTPYFKIISQDLSYLFDYHDEQVEKKQQAFASSILDVINSILKRYFEIRADNSLIFPAFMLARQSDSQGFLNEHIDRYYEIGKEYIRKDNLVGIRKVVNQYLDLYHSSLQIKYLGDEHSTEHPDAEHVLGYLMHLNSFAIEQKNEEAMFQIAEALGTIGETAVRNSHQIDLERIYDGLFNLVKGGFQQQTVVSVVHSSFARIIAKILLKDDHLQEVELKAAFEKINNAYPYGLLSLMQGNSAYFSRDLNKPYALLANYIVGTAQLIVQGDKSRLVSLDEAADLFWSQLRKLSEILVVDSHSVVTLFEGLDNALRALIGVYSSDKLSSKEKSKVEDKIKWLAYVPDWFIQKSKSLELNQSYQHGINIMGYIGIKSVELGLDSLALDLFDSIMKISGSLLEKDKVKKPQYGFDEPRTVQIACYIGIKLLSKSDNYLERIKKSILGYEELYKNYYSLNVQDRDYTRHSIKPNQLLIELLRTIDEHQGHPYRSARFDTPYTQAENYLFESTEVKEIESFIKKVWNIVVKD